jgi:hypothetical protein
VSRTHRAAAAIAEAQARNQPPRESQSAAFLGATDDRAAAVMTFATGAPRPVCTNPVRTCDDGDLVGGSVPARTWYATMTPGTSGSVRSVARD